MTPCSRSRAPITTSVAPPTSSSPGSTPSASTSPVASPSTWARRPVDSPRCCASAAPTPVIAVDVGHGQLAASVADDPGVISVEGFNVRYMTPESLARGERRRPRRPRVVTGDLSFISLGLVLPAARAVAAAGADFVLLVKPQFEVGRTAVQGRTRDGCRAPRRRRRRRAVGGVGRGARHPRRHPLPDRGHARQRRVRRASRASVGRNPTEWLPRRLGTARSRARQASADRMVEAP